jgi:SAM-dependent methyltransferase
MNEARRAEAPRLIEWTGERCVPWVDDAPIVYEHYHRYLWAAQLVRGRRVLDLASGEGFGAAILAQTAADVLGVDIDERAVLHGRANYALENLRFEQASATDLSAIDSGSLGAVVAFEMIEHLRDQERVVSEIERVLADDGVLVMSTPERRFYGAATGQENPFHERELTVEEFSALLHGSFANVAMWGQRTIAGSHMRSLDREAVNREAEHPAGQGEDFFIARAGGEWHATDAPDALFCVAVASNAPLPAIGRSSTLADAGLEVVRQAERAGAAAVAERDGLLAHANHHLAVRRDEIMALAARRDELEAARRELVAELAAERAFRSRVESSVTWQTFQRLRGALYGAIGERSRLGRAIGSALRLVGRVTVKRQG